MRILISDCCGNFAENKDSAKKLREEAIKPALADGEIVTLDFKDVDSSTQSFIHALISEIFQKDGESTLDMFEFKNCNKSVKSLIETVINYSLE